MAKKGVNLYKIASSIPWLSILAGVFVILLLTRMSARATTDTEAYGQDNATSSQHASGIRSQYPGLPSAGMGPSGSSSDAALSNACFVQSAVQSASNVQPDGGVNSQFAAVPESGSPPNGLANCSMPATVNASELLPKDRANGSFNRLDPSGGNFHGVNLLKAGYNIGIDTVGTSLRNANQQVRSEPPNPQVAVSPWMNSTISPDLMRVPLEIGCDTPCDTPCNR